MVLVPRSSRPWDRSHVDLALIVGVVSFVLLAGSVLLAAVWVHLELYRHADEVIIMRLVGATEGTIRGPFLVAVTVPGVVAGVLSVVGSLATVSGLSQAHLGPRNVGDDRYHRASSLLQLATAVFLPLVAAVITLARHAADATEN